MQALMANHSDRQPLFLEFSEALKRDVLSVVSFSNFNLKTLCLVGLFLLSYYLIRVKGYFFCGRNDLRFLSGFELALVRTLT